MIVTYVTFSSVRTLRHPTFTVHDKVIKTKIWKIENEKRANTYEHTHNTNRQKLCYRIIQYENLKRQLKSFYEKLSWIPKKNKFTADE